MQSLVPNDLHRIGDEPRVLDLRLAEALEFKAPRQIRELIARNKDELERHGRLSHDTTNPGPQGGRPATENWLNEAQAILICMRSNAPRAAEVRAEIITVFQAWRHGTLVPAVPTLNEIGHLLEPLRKTVERTHEIVEGTQCKVIELVRGQARIEARLHDAIPKKEFSEKTKRIFRYTVAKCFGGYCPCGCKQKIVDEKGNLLLDEHGDPLLNYDHWYSRERNGIDAGWPVHRECNQSLKDDDYRRNKHSRYVVFHEERKMVQADLRDPSKKSKLPSNKKRCGLTIDWINKR